MSENNYGIYIYKIYKWNKNKNSFEACNILWQNSFWWYTSKIVVTRCCTSIKNLFYISLLYIDSHSFNFIHKENFNFAIDLNRIAKRANRIHIMDYKWNNHYPPLSDRAVFCRMRLILYFSGQFLSHTAKTTLQFICGTKNWWNEAKMAHLMPNISWSQNEIDQRKFI